MRLIDLKIGLFSGDEASSLQTMFQLPEGSFDGFIFDCDGTLADSMPIHYRAWLRAFAHFSPSIDFPEDYFYSLGGTPTPEIVGINASRFPDHPPLDSHAVSEFKEKLFLEELEHVQPIAPVVAFAQSVKAQGFPVAVASGGVRHVVEKTLANIGLDQFFPIIITPIDVPRGKPFPDMFLLAAERMGVAPERCLVFEDAPPGFAAAEAAGMAWTQVESRRLKTPA
jgi:HAD superfamily hydrolase (TIGR01509 family)